MIIDHLLCFLIISAISIVKGQQIFFHENDLRASKEKSFFPGKTNEGELYSKRLQNAFFDDSLLRKGGSNYTDDANNKPSGQKCKSNPLDGISSTRKPEGNRKYNELEYENKSSSLKKIIFNMVFNANENSAKKTSTSLSSPSLSSSLSLNNRNFGEETTRKPRPSVGTFTSASVSAPSTSKLRLCELKYAEYIQRIFPEESDTVSDANDLEFDGRVLAAPGQYPHMTAVGFPAGNNLIDYKCGGSLISEQFVITAAHCTNFTGLRPTMVRIGDLNLKVEENYLEPQLRGIKTIHVHPDYKSNSHYNDIALLKLRKEVELTEFVRPIRLWTTHRIPFSTAYAMGYGATNFAKERTNRLTNLNMTIVPNDECNREMPIIPETKRGIISSQICARDYALNRDTCQGDSGGPLQLNIRGRRRSSRLHYQLIGITSYGLFCRSGFPSIFTRVYSYLDWIERIVWNT